MMEEKKRCNPNDALEVDTPEAKHMMCTDERIEENQQPSSTTQCERAPPTKQVHWDESVPMKSSNPARRVDSQLASRKKERAERKRIVKVSLRTV